MIKLRKFEINLFDLILLVEISTKEVQTEGDFLEFENQ